MAIVCNIIDRDDISFLVIWGYILKISRVKISSLSPIKLLIALKDIYNTKLSWMPEILIIII